MIVFRGIDKLLDRIFSAIGAALFSQFPQVINLYITTLAGALHEARINIEGFKKTAQEAGLSMTQYLDRLLQNSDPLIRKTGETIQTASNRLADYEAAYKSLSEAGIFARPFAFFYHVDAGLFKAMNFVPAVPLNFEGIVYALFGLLFGLGVYHAVVHGPGAILKRVRK